MTNKIKMSSLYGEMKGTSTINPNNHNCVNTLKAEKRIKVAGYRGFWSVIDDQNGYVLLEHNTHGDETCYLVVRASDFLWKQITLKNGEIHNIPFFDTFVTVFETYDDITTCLEDEGII